MIKFMSIKVILYKTHISGNFWTIINCLKNKVANKFIAKNKVVFCYLITKMCYKLIILYDIWFQIAEIIKRYRIIFGVIGYKVNLF